MKRDIGGLILGLFIFLFLDITKPFGYIIYVDFLFLGIIIMARFYPILPAFILAAIFGYIRDCLSLSRYHLYMFIFAIVVFVVYYGLKFLPKRWPSSILVCLALGIYVFSYPIFMGRVPLTYRLVFCLHSFLMYQFITYLLSRWLKKISVNYI